jgi:hypothetical protein
MEFVLTFMHLKLKLMEQNGHIAHVTYICAIVGLCKHKLQSMTGLNSYAHK